MPPRSTPRISKVLEAERAKDAAASEENLLDIVKAGNKFVAMECPKLTQSELDSIVQGPGIDQYWTQQDADEAVQDWHDHPMREYLLQPGGNVSLGPAWRYSARFYKMTVEDLISPLYQLEYDPSGHKDVIVINGQAQPHPCWSAPFCQSLGIILAHDMWMDDPSTMAICLQYVVKCYTNDQRAMRWPVDNPTTDRFFDVFAEVMAQWQDGFHSMPKVHDKVMRRLHGVNNPWSRLLRCIEGTACNTSVAPMTAPIIPNRGVGTYKVNKFILDKLIRALDAQLDRNGLPVYRKAEFISRAAQAARSTHDLPAQADLERMRDMGILGVRQCIAKRANVSAANEDERQARGASQPMVASSPPPPAAQPSEDSEHEDPFDPLGADRVTLDQLRLQVETVGDDMIETVKDFCQLKEIPHEHWDEVKDLTLNEFKEWNRARQNTLQQQRLGQLGQVGLQLHTVSGAGHTAERQVLSSSLMAGTRPFHQRGYVDILGRMAASRHVMYVGQDCRVVIDPSRLLFLQGKKHPQKTYYNAILTQPVKAGSDEIKFGSFENMEAFYNFVNGLKQSKHRSVRITSINIFHAETAGIANLDNIVDGGCFTSQQLLPYQPTSVWTTMPVRKLPKHHIPTADRVRENNKPLTEDEVVSMLRCANCLKFGHGIGDCVWPVDRHNGDISGCPTCNTKLHVWDNCPNVKWMNDETKLVVTGALKVNADTIMPWSRKNILEHIDTHKVVSLLENWDYDPVGKPVFGDPLTVGQIVLSANPPDSSWSAWKEDSRPYVQA